MRFLLACEGQSDTGLVSHIERVIIESSGETEVQGEHLGLPTSREAERRSDPKRILADALLAASEATGRRRRRIQRDFTRFRRQLLVNLPIGGPLEQLPSWRRFRDDTLCAIGA